MSEQSPGFGGRKFPVSRRGVASRCSGATIQISPSKFFDNESVVSDVFESPIDHAHLLLGVLSLFDINSTMEKWSGMNCAMPV